MKPSRIIVPGLGLVLGVFTATNAFAWCDERFLFTCPIEPPSAVESVEPPPPPAKPKQKRSRHAVTVAQQTAKVAVVPASEAAAAMPSEAVQKDAAGTLPADDAAANPVSLSIPVLALDLSLQIAPSMVEQVRPATSACLIEQSFNDLVAAIAPPTSQRKAKVAERPYDVLMAAKRADLGSVGTE